jgi:hypothetical protein
LLSACASEYRQAKTDESGYLPIGNDADVKITVNQGVDTSQFKKVLYVSTDMHGVIDWYGYQDYIMEAFRQLDFFGEVVTRQPTLYINTTPPLATKSYEDKSIWFDMVDPVSNRDILKQYGPNVLIAKSILRNRSDDVGERGGFYYQLQLIDPSTSRVLWQGSKTGGNTLGLDMNLINPILNYAKGYLLAYDPYYVPQHPSTRQGKDQQPVTPFSYEQGES